jgi:hypothetical protein
MRPRILFYRCNSLSHFTLGGAHPLVSLPVRAAGVLRRSHVGLPDLGFVVVLLYDEICAGNFAF